MPRQSNDTIAVLGIDLGKNTFHLIGLNERGAISLRQKLSRRQLEVRLANLPPCLIGMEACVGAHRLSRRLKALGHDARLMPARYVIPICLSFDRDCEQLLQALHRVRSRLVGERTAIANEIRAFLLDRGIAITKGLNRLRAELPGILATRTDALSPRLLHIIEDLVGDWRHLDQRIDNVSRQIEALAAEDAGCERLMTVPGVGPIISSATVAAIGTGDVFAKGRDFSAWLGLVPKQISTGDRTILGKISKRGNKYLRTLFVQAARVVLLRPRSWERQGLKPWIEAAAKRLHHNVLAIALANKLARIAWSVLHHGREFEVRKISEPVSQPS
jgi:transposase